MSQVLSYCSQEETDLFQWVTQTRAHTQLNTKSAASIKYQALFTYLTPQSSHLSAQWVEIYHSLYTDCPESIDLTWKSPGVQNLIQQRRDLMWDILTVSLGVMQWSEIRKDVEKKIKNSGKVWWFPNVENKAVLLLLHFLYSVFFWVFGSDIWVEGQ